jgi:hypothetical protein
MILWKREEISRICEAKGIKIKAIRFSVDEWQYMRSTAIQDGNGRLVYREPGCRLDVLIRA